ncbi:MAG: YfhO family protein [Candidatus Latescibacterota bacterium]
MSGGRGPAGERGGSPRVPGLPVGLALLAGGIVALFWPAVLLRQTFFVQDVMVQNYPFRAFFAAALKEGSLPLWDPAINCGFPLFAEGQAGVLYPPNLLSYLLLSPAAGLNLGILCHYWLAAAGMCLFLRALGAGPAACVTGGLTFACSGFLVVRAMSPNYVGVCAWMPVFFLSLEKWVREGRGSWAAVAAGVGGLQLLAGHPQAAAYALLAGLAFGAWRCWGGGVGWRWAAGILAGIPLAAGCLAAVQLLPTAELVRASHRGGGLPWEEFVSMSLPPERLVTLLLPNYFGSDGVGSYWGQEAGFFIQLCGYVGVLPLLLALVALHQRRQGAAFFGALAGVGLVLALGRWTGVFDALYHLPAMRSFRIPTRFLLWFAFAIAVLAGLGLDCLLARRGQGRHRGWWWVCLGMAAVAGGMLWLNRRVLLSSEQDLLTLGGGSLAMLAGQLRQDAARLATLLLAGGLVLSWRGGRGRALVAWGVPLLIGADLFSFGRGFNGLVDRAVYEETPATARAILADWGANRAVSPRVLSLVSEANSPYDWHGGWMLDQASYRAYPATLRLYTGGLYGLHNALPGWSPLHLERHLEFARTYLGAADLAGVDYLVSARPLRRSGLRLILDGPINVYRNSAALPRTYLVGDYEVEPASAERLGRLRSASFDPRRLVLLEESPELEPEGHGGEARITAYGLDRVEVEVRPRGTAILVLSDTAFPGWRAWVDGRPARILPANHVFRAVGVPAGAHRVSFRYEPYTVRVGAWVSGVAWLALGGALLALRRLPPPSPVVPRHTPALGPLILQVLLVVLLHGAVTHWSLWAGALARSRVPLAGWGA